jgi:hypothetical protein
MRADMTPPRFSEAIAGPTASPTDKNDQKRVEEEEREWGLLPKVRLPELPRQYACDLGMHCEAGRRLRTQPKSPALPKA